VENIQEKSIFVDDNLCSDFWDTGNKLKKEIRAHLLKIALDFYSGVKFTHGKKVIKDIYFTGSLAGYNYHEQSDVDIHIVLDYSMLDDNEELLDNYFKFAKSEWNGKHDITIKGRVVEIGIDNVINNNHHDGVYSLIHDKWVKEPTKQAEDAVDGEEIDRYAKKIMGKIDTLMQDYALSDAEDAASVAYDKAKELKHKIKEMRQKALDSKKELYSVGNLVFKSLRNSGYMEKLSDFMHEMYDKMYIIEHNMEN